MARIKKEESASASCLECDWTYHPKEFAFRPPGARAFNAAGVHTKRTKHPTVVTRETTISPPPPPEQGHGTKESGTRAKEREVVHHAARGV